MAERDVYDVVNTHPNGNKRPSDSYLEALLDEATDGPWLADQCWLRGPRDVFLGGFGNGDTPKDARVANAHLCALARRLAEEVLELRAAADVRWDGPAPTAPAASSSSPIPRDPEPPTEEHP